MRLVDSVVSIAAVLLVVGVGEERSETLELQMRHLVVVAKADERVHDLLVVQLVEVEGVGIHGLSLSIKNIQGLLFFVIQSFFIKDIVCVACRRRGR